MSQNNITDAGKINANATMLPQKKVAGQRHLPRLTGSSLPVAGTGIVTGSTTAHPLNHNNDDRQSY